MARQLTESELEAYLDEALTPPEMAEVEAQLRQSPELLKTTGEHQQPPRCGRAFAGRDLAATPSQLSHARTDGQLSAGVLDDEQADYIRFHLDVVACRLCHANLEDLADNDRPNRTRQ